VRICNLLYSEIDTYVPEQYGGKYVVNPSGGLEAKGHPLGATGLGMHFYIMSKVLPFNALPIR
jgi:acetyl-CoA acetyltransferase